MSVPLVFALDLNYLIRAGILVECKILNCNENASFSLFLEVYADQ